VTLSYTYKTLVYNKPMDDPICCDNDMIFDDMNWEFVCWTCGNCVRTMVPMFTGDTPVKQPSYYSRFKYLLSFAWKRGLHFDDQQEHALRVRFRDVESAYMHVCPPTRKNFLAYKVVLYGLCRLLDLPCPPRPRISKANAAIWKAICERNGWSVEF